MMFDKGFLNSKCLMSCQRLFVLAGFVHVEINEKSGISICQVLYSNWACDLVQYGHADLEWGGGSWKKKWK